MEKLQDAPALASARFLRCCRTLQTALEVNAKLSADAYNISSGRAVITLASLSRLVKYSFARPQEQPCVLRAVSGLNGTSALCAAPFLPLEIGALPPTCRSVPRDGGRSNISLRRRLGEGRLGCSAAVGSYCVRSCRDGIQPLSGLWIPLTGAWSCGQHRPTRASAYSTLPRSNALIMGKSTKRQRGDKDLFAFVRFPRQRGERFSHPSSEIASGLLCSEMQETSIDIWRLRRVAQPVCT